MTGFLSSNTKKKESPAAVLAARYSSVCTVKNLTSVSDFQKLLSKHKFEEIMAVIDWLTDQSEGLRCKPSSWFRYRFRYLKVEAKQDLAGYPVGDVSCLREEIETTGESIPDEFIQHAWDEYSRFLGWLKTEPEAADIYVRLDPPRSFTIKWFGKLVPKYSRKYRRFSVHHEKFRGYLFQVADTCASRKIVERLLKAYGDGDKE